MPLARSKKTGKSQAKPKAPAKGKAKAPAKKKQLARNPISSSPPPPSSSGASESSEEAIRAFVIKLKSQIKQQRAKRRLKREKDFHSDIERLEDEIKEELPDGDAARVEICKDTKVAVDKLVHALRHRSKIEKQIHDETFAQLKLYKQARRELEEALQERIQNLEAERS